MLSTHKLEYPQNQEKTDNLSDKGTPNQYTIKLCQELAHISNTNTLKTNPSKHESINKIWPQLESTISNETNRKKTTLVMRLYGKRDSSLLNKDICFSQKSRNSLNMSTQQQQPHQNYFSTPSYYKGCKNGTKHKDYNDKYNLYYFKLLQAEENKLEVEMCEDDNLLKSKMLKIKELMFKKSQSVDNAKTKKKKKYINDCYFAKKVYSQNRKFNKKDKDHNKGMIDLTSAELPIKFNSDQYVKDI